MTSKTDDPNTKHPEGEQPRGLGGTLSRSGYPEDDDPKSAGYVNEGDGPLPEQEEPRAPRK